MKCYAKLAEPKSKLGSTGAIIGLDLGARFTGVALAQRSPAIALPHRVIEATHFAALWEQLQAMDATAQAEAWVLGLPLTADGTPGEQAHFVQKFARFLSYRHTAPIWLVDERMTSRAAARTSSGERTDAEAAALILSAFLSAPQLAQRAALT